MDWLIMPKRQFLYDFLYIFILKFRQKSLFTFVGRGMLLMSDIPMRYYKIIDIHGRLKTVYRPVHMMQPYVDTGLAMERLSDYDGWRRCYKGIRKAGGGRIEVEPFKWDHEKMAEAYAPLMAAYRKILSGQILPPEYRSVA
ncbi:MAG: hypothetical protein JW789_04560 [Candidatus Aenigmarchaeota archaeon]|nr:hypothetical protein [Candidatus Aenigmarchaeota archaeon]